MCLKHPVVRWLLAWAFCGSCVVQAQASSPPVRWVELDVEVGEASYPVSVRIPAAMGTQRLPVVLFLHGAGERRQKVNNLSQLRSTGLPGLPPTQPHILVVPQVIEGGWWSDAPMMTLAMRSLEDALARWPGDRNRVYLTGLSMGGHGALQLAAHYPDYFAAVLALCPRLGRPPYLQQRKDLPTTPLDLAQRLRTVPLWLVHGAKDMVVPVSNSRRLSAALARLNADARYTELPDAGHQIWQQAYAQTELLDWLFGQSLVQSSVQSAAPRQ